MQHCCSADFALCAIWMFCGACSFAGWQTDGWVQSLQIGGRLLQFQAQARMHQLQATAKLHKLDELPHLHLSHTFTYYWPPYFQNFIKLHFTQFSPFSAAIFSYQKLPRPPEIFTRVILEASQGSNFSQILELDTCIISILSMFTL